MNRSLWLAGLGCSNTVLTVSLLGSKKDLGDWRENKVKKILGGKKYIFQRRKELKLKEAQIWPKHQYWDKAGLCFTDKWLKPGVQRKEQQEEEQQQETSMPQPWNRHTLSNLIKWSTPVGFISGTIVLVGLTHLMFLNCSASVFEKKQKGLDQAWAN